METKNADLSSLKIDRSKKSFSSGNKTIFYVLAIVLLLVLLYFGYTLFLADNFSGKTEVKLTTVTLQTSSQANAVLTASGYVVAQRKANVASKGTGRLVYLGVVEGDKVRKDQILARIEDSDIKAMVEQAKANLRLAEADLLQAGNNLKRVKELYAKNLSSAAEVENAEAVYEKVKANIELAKANLTAAEIQLENTLIRAPFDGTVLTKNADIGEIVAPLGASITSKGAVVTMADMTSLQVEADVSESNIEKIETNQECEITLDAYPGEGYPGYVAKIVPTANRSKATVMVKIGFKQYDSRVLPEMSAKVSFISKDKKTTEKEKPVLLVPTSAIVPRNGKQVAFIVKDDTAYEIEVKAGRTFGSYQEILSGLTEGDKIIDSVPDKIINGTKVKIK